MSRHFSSEELHHLRNDFPIDALIKALGVCYRQGSGERFRFQCPRCLGYHTATHTQTNLARCFTCQTNFNSIELVMLVKQLPFVASVHFLQQHKTSLTRAGHTTNPQISRYSSAPILVSELLRQIASAVKEPR